MNISKYARFINGYGFKPSAADLSSIEFPFSFTLEQGKSIGVWINKDSATNQNLFINNAGTQRISFSGGMFLVKTNLGNTYSTPIEWIDNTLAFFLLTINGSNELILYFGHYTSETLGITIVTEIVIDTLDTGEKVIFDSPIHFGKAGDGFDYMGCTGDDISFWNITMNSNMVEYLYNRGCGVNCKLVPFSANLVHYIPMDNLNFSDRATSDVVTGIQCTLTSTKFQYYTPDSLYTLDGSDYVSTNTSDSLTNWSPADLTSEGTLAFTYIFRTDVARGILQTNQPSVIFSFGGTTEGDCLAIYYGNIGSAEFMGGLLDNTSGASKNLLWSWAGGSQDSSYNVGEWTIQTYLLTPSGYYLIHDGQLVASNGNSTPILNHGSWSGGFRIAKTAFSYDLYDHTGMLRHISIMKKSGVTTTDIINLHKSYLGLAPTDSVVGADKTVLETTTFNPIGNGYTGSDFYAYWKGDRMNALEEFDATGLYLKDMSGNNRHLQLVNYTFPTAPSVARRGNKIL